MKSITRHSGILEIIERLPQSTNGNPRYLFTIDGYTAATMVDSHYGYELPNHDGKRVTVTLGSHYGRLSLNSIESH